MLPPRDKDEALDLILEMESYYAEAIRQFEVDNQFYDGNLDEFYEPPDGYFLTIPTTARAIVDEAVDNTVPHDMIVHYAPRGRGKKAAESADRVRRYLKAQWAYWRRSSGDIDVLRDFTKNLYKHGKAVFKVTTDYTLWPSLDDTELDDIRTKARQDGGDEDEAVEERIKLIEELRASNNPFSCRSLPPECIMEDPTAGARKLWAIERYTADIAEVRNYYAEDFEELRQPWYRNFEIHEVWTATYVDRKGRIHDGKHWVFVNLDMIIEEPNVDGEHPYVIRHSGFGRESYEGRPELKAVGFYTTPTKSMLLAEMRRFSHFEAIFSQLAFPVGFVDERIDPNDLNFTPGFINAVPEDVLATIDKMWVQPELPDAEYLQSLTAIAAQIERGTTQKAIRGANLSGVDSAAQHGMITAQARLRLDAARMAVEDAVAEVNARVLRKIDKRLKDSISVFAAEQETAQYSVGPDQINGHYVNSVTFQPNEDAVKERKLILASDARGKAFMSRYDALVFAGFENPMELIARADADELMQDPIIKRFMAKEALADWGYDAAAIELAEQLEATMQQQRMQQLLSNSGVGTLPNVGDPNTASGVPAPAPSNQDPAAAMAQFGPQPPQMPGGAPAAVEQGEVAGMVRDIRALNGGGQQ